MLTVDGLMALNRMLRDVDADCVLIYAPPGLQAAETWVLARDADALLVAMPAAGAHRDETAELADLVAQLDVPSAVLALQDERGSGRAPAVPRASRTVESGAAAHGHRGGGTPGAAGATAPQPGRAHPVGPAVQRRQAGP